MNLATDRTVDITLNVKPSVYVIHNGEKIEIEQPLTITILIYPLRDQPGIPL